MVLVMMLMIGMVMNVIGGGDRVVNGDRQLIVMDDGNDVGSGYSNRDDVSADDSDGDDDGDSEGDDDGDD